MAKRCDQCEAAVIQGMYCHESGCPLAWHDEVRECAECGCDYEPEERHQRMCSDCLNPEPMDSGWPNEEDVVDLADIRTAAQGPLASPFGWDHV